MLTKEEKQSVIDYVVPFIAKQGGSGTNGEACVYLCDSSGRQCLIGSLLTDEQCIEATAENYTVGDIIERGWNGWDLDDGPFLTSLQNCHDVAAGRSANTMGATPHLRFLSELDKQLNGFCKRRDLDYPGGLS